MASKGLTRVKADWSQLASRLRGSDVTKLNKLKSKIDANAVKVSSLPDSLPKIDWAHYKAHASNPKLVEELEKKYASLSLEKPKVNPSHIEELELAKKQDVARFEKFSVVAQSYIESAGVVKKKFEDMIPVNQMTMEDWILTFPYWSFSIEHPSVWPHLGRMPGLSREEAAAFDQPDPVPYATPTAWKEWEVRKKKYYS